MKIKDVLVTVFYNYLTCLSCSSSLLTPNVMRRGLSILFLRKLWYTRHPGCFDRLKFHEILQMHMELFAEVQDPAREFFVASIE